jgi:DNA-binding beta-propeller fold protein YncE
VTAGTGVINTVAGLTILGFATCGDGYYQLNSPQGIAVDDAGVLHIGDRDNQRIRSLVGGLLQTLSGLVGTSGYSGDGGLATQALLNSPHGVCLDHDGNLYIADRDNHAIRKIDARTGIITTFAGTGLSGFSGDGGPATSARLNGPTGVAAFYIKPTLTPIVAAY